MPLFEDFALRRTERLPSFLQVDGRISHFIVLAGASVFFFVGCSGPSHLAQASGNHAFIEYWPPVKRGALKLAIKDNIDMKSVVTTAGSGYLATHARPAKRDAACLTLARERHVQMVGKTNLSEFAEAPSGINEYFGTPKNPLSHFLKRIPGGSSSGSAVAVATGMADVAFGTDTAGSVRVPAACCGVVGLKTTRNLIPLRGAYSIAPTRLDTIGPLAKDIAQTAKGMDLLERGFAAKFENAKAKHANPRRIRVGRLYLKGTDGRVDAAIDGALAAAGFQVIRLGDRFRDRWDQAKEDGDTIAAVGVWMRYQQYGSAPGISARTKSGILLGHLEYGSKYAAALFRENAWRKALGRELAQVDVIALPTLQSIPPPLFFNVGIRILDEWMLHMQNTVPANLAGFPALAMPVPLHHAGFPVASLQFIGPPRSEAELLNAGRFVETAMKERAAQ